MKSISARQFRTSFADLTEPVTVLRRDTAGNFQVLGEWHPQSGGAAPVEYVTLPANAMPADAERARANYVQFHPVPKPSQKGK